MCVLERVCVCVCVCACVRVRVCVVCAWVCAWVRMWCARVFMLHADTNHGHLDVTPAEHNVMCDDTSRGGCSNLPVLR